MTEIVTAGPEREDARSCGANYQLGMVEQVRQNLEKANERVYGKGKVLHFYDSQPVARKEEEKSVCK